MDPLHPRHFLWDYVEPSIEHFYKNAWTEHLAIHAITQTDILAEITARWLKKWPSAYREDLGSRRETLRILRDAHDTHKHGMLNRPSATHVSNGQRPRMKIRYGYVIGHFFVGAPPKPFKIVELELNDGRGVPVVQLLSNALLEWAEEFEEQGIPAAVRRPSD